MNATHLEMPSRFEERTEALLDGTRDAESTDDTHLVRSLRREIAELRQQVSLMSSYQNMAYRDFLTGVANRRAFEERLREECARAVRTPSHNFALILADVDDQKLVNDTLGHTAGDEVLVSVARFLSDSVREVDLVYRLGGDEFALLLPCTDEAGAAVVLARLRTAFEAARERFVFPVGLSLGAATVPSCPPDTEALVMRADTEMYLDKRKNKQGRPGR